ncbi:hypothetical protein AC579_3236, partial [Pseudocercospora musae]
MAMTTSFISTYEDMREDGLTQDMLDRTAPVLIDNIIDNCNKDGGAAKAIAIFQIHEAIEAVVGDGPSKNLKAADLDIPSVPEVEFSYKPSKPDKIYSLPVSNNDEVSTQGAELVHNDIFLDNIPRDSPIWLKRLIICGLKEVDPKNFKFFRGQSTVDMSFKARVFAIARQLLESRGKIDFNKANMERNITKVDVVKEAFNDLPTSEYLKLLEKVYQLAFSLEAWEGSAASDLDNMERKPSQTMPSPA